MLFFPVLLSVVFVLWVLVVVLVLLYLVPLFLLLLLLSQLHFVLLLSLRLLLLTVVVVHGPDINPLPPPGLLKTVIFEQLIICPFNICLFALKILVLEKILGHKILTKMRFNNICNNPENNWPPFFVKFDQQSDICVSWVSDSQEPIAWDHELYNRAL